MAVGTGENAILAVFTQVSMLAVLSQLTILDQPERFSGQGLTEIATGEGAFPCTHFGITVAILKPTTVATGNPVETCSFDLFYAAHDQTDDPGTRCC
jgi:hypothetical protein